MEAFKKAVNEKKILKQGYLVFLGLSGITFLSFLGKKDVVDVREDTTGGNGDVAEKLVQFFVIADGELKMTGRDGLLLVIVGSVTGQFEDFSGQVFKDGSQVDGGTRADALSIVSTTKKTMDTTNRELKTSFVRARA